MQETETQNYKTKDKSAGGSIGLSDGFNFNANTNKMDSDYKSVTEQAGIYAGNKGFDINVAGNTDLKGAVIDSTATKDKNTLNTGTITFSDIENKAEYSTSGRGVNIQHKFGNKGDMTDEQKAWEGVTPSTGIGTKDKDESITKSAIAEARINIMKPENQRQDITKLDRKTTRTLNKLGKIFDKDKIEEKQELAGLFQEMWHTTVGDLMQDKTITDDQRKAMNILGGVIAAELGGADIKAGLSGGATTELLQSAFSQIKDPSLRKVAVAVTAVMVAKGTGQEAGTAANVAEAIQIYNEETHKDYAEHLKRIQNDPKNAVTIQKEGEKKSDEKHEATKKALENDEFQQRYIEAYKNNNNIEVFEGYVVQGVDVATGKETGFIPIFDENGKCQGILPTKIYTNLATHPTVREVSKESIALVANGYSAFTGFVSANPIGFSAGLYSFSSALGNAGNIYNILTNDKVQGDFIKDYFIMTSPKNGEDAYHITQSYFTTLNLLNSLKQAKKGGKIEVVVSGAIDLYTIMENAKKLKKEQKK